jgi:hypothetical protein
MGTNSYGDQVGSLEFKDDIKYLSAAMPTMIVQNLFGFHRFFCHHCRRDSSSRLTEKLEPPSYSNLIGLPFIIVVQKTKYKEAKRLADSISICRKNPTARLLPTSPQVMVLIFISNLEDQVEARQFCAAYPKTQVESHSRCHVYVKH